ncbi:MAG: carbohydrate ABC transporter permease, partial [Lachnospiraceae bacterium]|nr:carbohydrate ABC transporter permease [Lachnospiraceae bacterium]
IPNDLIEAAKIDGSGDFRTFLTVVLPMCKASMATVGLYIALAYWNDWYNAMLYIDDEKMYPLQYFLYHRLNNLEAYKRILSSQANLASDTFQLPTQTLRMALTVVVTGPVILFFPAVQKYFVQGITIGAVKG